MTFYKYTVTNSRGIKHNFGDYEQKAIEFIEAILKQPNVKVEITNVEHKNYI